jgi:hypothetical protein
MLLDTAIEPLPCFDTIKDEKTSGIEVPTARKDTFDILICLGVPWFIRALFTGFHNEIWYIHVQSDALAYTVVSLLISLIVLYCILVASRFVLSKTLGIICLAIYAVFLTISLLFELNVFYQVNLPTCIVDTNLDKYYN